MAYDSTSGKRIPATRTKMDNASPSPAQSQGETGGAVGSSYSATLVEYPNKSLNNVGPDGQDPMLKFPAGVGQGIRKTGRI